MRATSAESAVPPPQSSPRRSLRSLVATVCLATAATLLVGYRLGDRALHDFDEPLTGSRALAMLTNHEPLTVYFNGTPDYRKPPLNYWLIAAAYRLGGVSELTTRLPIAIAAGLLLIALYRLGRWLTDPHAGALAVVALLGSGLFLVRARYATADMLLYAATLDAMLACVEARYVRAGLGVGIAILAKGLAGVLAPLVVLVWIALTGNLAPLRRPTLWLGVALAAAVIAPWVGWNALRHHDEFVEVFWKGETANRLVRKMPWPALLGFYRRKLADQLDLLPAAALLAPFAAWLDPTSRREWRRSALLIAFAVAALGTLATIRPPNAHYVLIPALPLALAAGRGLRALARARGARAALGWLLLGVATGWSMWAMERTSISLVPVGIATVLAVVALALMFQEDSGPPLARVGVIAFGAAALLAAGNDLDDVLEHPGSAAAVRAVAPAIRDATDPAQSIVYEGRQLQTAVFYSQRNVIGLDALLESSEALPERWAGIFTSPIYRALAGWDATLLASHGATSAVLLRRSENDPSPSTMPRLVVAPALGERAFETYRLLGAAPVRIEREGFVNVIATAREARSWEALATAAGTAPSLVRDGTSDAWTVDLGAPTHVAALRITLDLQKRDHLPGLSIAAATESGELHELVSTGEIWTGYAWDGASIQATHGAFIEARFPATEVRTLTIRILQPRDPPAIVPTAVELSSR